MFQWHTVHCEKYHFLKNSLPMLKTRPYLYIFFQSYLAFTRSTYVCSITALGCAFAWKIPDCALILRIFKAATSYVNHAWNHWNKRVFQCSKCRLQFLTLKEKSEHQTKNHQTFKKPEQLAGLPPGTEVRIRTSAHLGPRGAAPAIESKSHPCHLKKLKGDRYGHKIVQTCCREGSV